MKSEIIKENYKGFEIYFYNKLFLQLGKNIVDKSIQITEEYKITKRNYVVKIAYKGKDYILKSPGNEHRLIQRKIMTIFKKGEALNTLINLKKLEEEGLDIYAKPFLAIVRRKNKMIVESYLVLEYIKSDYKFSKKFIDDILKIEKLMYGKGVYHGDFNPSNLIYTKENIKVIDTQGKKYKFGSYRYNYDLLTMEDSIYNKFGFENWYKKDIWFYLAYGMKKFKRLTFIKKIKNIRKKIRNKNGE